MLKFGQAMKPNYKIRGFEIYTDLRMQTSPKGRLFTLSGVSSFEYRFIGREFKSKTKLFYLFRDNLFLDGETKGFYVVLDYNFEFDSIVFFNDYSET